VERYIGLAKSTFTDEGLFSGFARVSIGGRSNKHAKSKELDGACLLLDIPVYLPVNDLRR